MEPTKALMTISDCERRQKERVARQLTTFMAVSALLGEPNPRHFIPNSFEEDIYNGRHSERQETRELHEESTDA